eukprot:Phypoly_transcript_14457.p1 GENE.Phypoly_transcript_14457~~Phypoly_transcript_14457.p1  ORF type:complete len:238 (+),score=12.56 Phypoly_transcript_14457:222-935(+)
MINDLPEDVLQKILEHLDLREVVILGLVNSRLRSFVLGHNSYIQTINQIWNQGSTKDWSLWKRYIYATDKIGSYITYIITFPLAIISFFFIVFSGFQVTSNMWKNLAFHLYSISWDYLYCMQKYRRQKLAPVGVEDLSKSKRVLFNFMWIFLGWGLIYCIALYLVGILQMITLVGLSSGLETIRIAWYMTWPAGFKYSKYDLKKMSNEEKRQKIMEVIDKYNENNSHPVIVRDVDLP